MIPAGPCAMCGSMMVNVADFADEPSPDSDRSQPSPFDPDPRAVRADATTAVLSGVGAGLGLISIGFAPIAAVVGLPLSGWAWRSCRSAYRTGRIGAIVGVILNMLGLGMMIVGVLDTGM